MLYVIVAVLVVAVVVLMWALRQERARSKSLDRVMDDAVAKLDDYVARIGTTFDLKQIDQRAMTTVQDYTLPEAEVMPSLSKLQEWLTARLPEG